MKTQEQVQEWLHAYHDGELSRWQRWRMERRLAGDARLRSELAGLEQTSSWIREIQPTPSGPDLWASIAAELPALDARLPAAEEPEESAWSAPLRWILRPLPAGALATAVIAVAVAIGLMPGPTAPMTAVRSLDALGHQVIVLPGDADTTVIWVLDDVSESSGRRDGHGRA